jgi:hypothetical protein
MHLTENLPSHLDKANKNQQTMEKSENRSISLIDGQFSGAEAIDLLTRLFHLKIKFHEEHIDLTEGEENVKMREKKIKELQRNLFELRRYAESSGKSEFLLKADISIQAK